MGMAWDDIASVKQATRGSIQDYKRMPWETSKAPKFNLPQPAFDLSADSNQRMQGWHAEWLALVHRVLSPGGLVAAFGGTRTFHRLAAAMDQAGFAEIHLETWCYATGFPKSLNIGKSLDKAAGAERRVAGQYVSPENTSGRSNHRERIGTSTQIGGLPDITAPATPEAQKWDGWGTNLKPAWEPVLIGVKKGIGSPEIPCLTYP